MLLLVTVLVPSRPVLKPQLIPKLQKSYKITNQTKVKVMVQKIGLKTIGKMPIEENMKKNVVGKL